MHRAEELLLLITKSEINKEFGQPFIKTFVQYFGKDVELERAVATGIGCSLFLSSIKEGFSTEKLHAYVNNIREEHPFIAFDCKSYEPLYATIKEDFMILLDKNKTYTRTNITKKEIFEAFDFVTNI